MIDDLNDDIAAFAGAIGVIVDRVSDGDIVLGNAWLIDELQAVTCAHLLAPYDGKMQALKFSLPTRGEMFGVEKVAFHPKFARKSAGKLAMEMSGDVISPAHLQSHNVAVLSLTKTVADLSASEKKDLNDKLTEILPDSNSGLVGKLSEIDLFLIIQAIVNARKEGTLVITDQRHKPIARIFCQNGLVTHVVAGSLSNEMAFYQIFQRRNKDKGNFFFQLRTEPDWIVDRAITRPPEMLLLEAHRRADEGEKLLQALGGSQSYYRSIGNALRVDMLPAECVEATKQLWQYLDGNIPIGQLWQLADHDDYVIYLALVEMLKTRQIEEVPADRKQTLPDKNSSAPYLVLGEKIPLTVNEELKSLSSDYATGRLHQGAGRLLGSLKENSPEFMHDIRVNSDEIGSPIFRNGIVVGMHCGPLPFNREGLARDRQLQQMVWIETVLECLRQSGQKDTLDRVSRSATAAFDKIKNTLVKDGSIPASGCHELAKFQCPKCRRTSLCSAIVCKGCGQRLIRELPAAPPKDWKVAAYCCLVFLLIVGIFLPVKSASRIRANPTFFSLPEKSWVATQTGVYSTVTNTWGSLQTGSPIAKNTPIGFTIDIKHPVYLYILDKRAGDEYPLIAYPNATFAKTGDQLLPVGARVTIPDTTIKPLIAFTTSPEDTIILIASEKKLPVIEKDQNHIADSIFTAVDSQLTRDQSINGAEIRMGDLLPNNVESGGGDNLLYVKRLISGNRTD